MRVTARPGTAGGNNWLGVSSRVPDNTAGGC